MSFLNNFLTTDLQVTIGIALLSTVFLGLARVYFNGPMYKKKVDLTNKVVIVTGANIGIGYETAKRLAVLNATVILASRDEKKGLAAVNQIQLAVKDAKVHFIKLNLASSKSIRNFVEEFKKQFNRLDILINNAGIAGIAEKGLTEDGFELQFGTNHLGHFLLTHLLLDRLKASAPSRVVNVSSEAHLFGALNFDNLNSEKTYSRAKAYGDSKLANVLFSRELQKRYGSEGVSSYSLHPGTINTDLANKTGGGFFEKIFIAILAKPLIAIMGKDLVHGAQTTIYCAIAPEGELIGGEYYKDCKVGKSSEASKNVETAKKLWEKSVELLRL